MSVGKIIGLVLLVVGVLFIAYNIYDGYVKYADPYGGDLGGEIIKIIAGVVISITGGIIMVKAKAKE